MSKTRGLFKRMSMYNAEKARNLVDAMLMSTKEIGWDSNHQLIVNGKVYHGTDIVRLITHVMSPADPGFKKPIGLNVFVKALKKIGLEPDYVKNKDIKRILRTNSQSDEDDEELFTDNSSNEEDEDDNDNDTMYESNESDIDSCNETDDSMNECSASSDEYNNQSDSHDVDDNVDNSETNVSEDDIFDDDGVDDTDGNNRCRQKYNWKSISASEDESETNLSEYN